MSIKKFERALCLRDVGKSEINRGQAREIRKIVCDLIHEDVMKTGGKLGALLFKDGRNRFLRSARRGLKRC